MKLTLKILAIVLSALLCLALALLLTAYALTRDAALDFEKLSLKGGAAVTVFAADGSEADLPRGGGTARIQELPAYLPNAFVAVEDKRFYSHGGLDYRRMAKAAMKNLASFSFREGASTISQQLIKNTHLSGEKTIKRKLKEIKLAKLLEKNYSKQEILELYLNSIYFGHSAFGIDSAARFYFGKAPKELSPAESATLAALVKSPNRYSPFRDAEKCLSRRNFVLSLMKEQNYLSDSEYAAAKAEPLPAEPSEEVKPSSYFSLALEELALLLPDAGSGEPLKVYTYLDRSLQEKLEQTTTDCDCSLLVCGNEGHSVKAFHSTCGLLRRLPASTIKPLAVYAPAIEEDLVSPATPVLDEKTDFGGYCPENYDKTYGGYLSVRDALARSANVPAVRILNELGVDKAAKYLKKMALPLCDEDKTLALALGGMREGFTLKEIADGYSVFANGGRFSPSAFIERVEDARGNILYARDSLSKMEERQVFSEETCSLVDSMLKTAVKEGTAKKLRGLNFEVCAKTGTGGTDKGNTDAYTIAYTLRDTVAVWLGNRDNSPIDASGGGMPCNLALSVLQTLYQDSPPPDFSPCENVVEAALDQEEYEKNHRLLLADPASPSYLSLHELFKKSALPQGVSSKFSAPKIQTPLIQVKNGAVTLILCQTYYYDYVVKRESDGQISTIYSGKYREEIVDNSVEGGKTYTYSVTPVYQGIEGETVKLPSVHIEKSSGELPDDWWND